MWFRAVAMKLTSHKTGGRVTPLAIASAADLSEGVARLGAVHGAPQSSGKVFPFANGMVRAQSVG
jgi:hypothetical protein